MNKDERNEKIEQYGRGFQLLTDALLGVPRDTWTYKPSAEDWSVREIIVHMADSESMAALRLRKLVVEPGSALMGYEEAKWAGALNYNAQDPDASLEIIKLTRQTTYSLLQTLPDDVFSHSVKHPEYAEPYTFDKWLNIYARHIPDHIEQIEKTYEAWKRR